MDEKEDAFAPVRGSLEGAGRQRPMQWLSFSSRPAPRDSAWVPQLVQPSSFPVLLGVSHHAGPEPLGAADGRFDYAPLPPDLPPMGPRMLSGGEWRHEPSGP